MTESDAKQKLSQHKVHPAAALFPLMAQDELRELASDIKERGLIQPIVEHEGAILDGRNRFIACCMADVLPEFTQWEPTGSPTAWVLSVNLKRRHLTASQKAAVAAESLPMFEAEAKERQKKAVELRHAEERGDVERVVQEKFPELQNGQARDKAAAVVGVNPRYVSDAKAIKQTSPETFDKVLAGEVTIPEAKRNLRPIQPLVGGKGVRNTTGWSTAGPRPERNDRSHDPRLMAKVNFRANKTKGTKCKSN